MVDLVVLGSIALDSIETPFGKVRDVLGGSASYAAYAASFFCEPGIVSVIGEDFPRSLLDTFQKRRIDLSGVQVRAKTFRWSGRYKFDMNVAETLRTELDVLEEFNAELPRSYCTADYIFLGNMDPDLQLRVLDQVRDPELTVLDTMNCWIESKPDRLAEAISRIDVLMVNDMEIRQIFNTSNLVKAANRALELGPKAVAVKRGEHGISLFTDGRCFGAPACPLTEVADPTGCGDCFGGSFTGYLAQNHDNSEVSMRKASIYASAVASYNAQGFGMSRLLELTRDEIEDRVAQLMEMMRL